MAISSFIRFQIDYQLTNSPIDLKWTDTTNYVGLTTSNMRILLWVVDGGGTTIYKNGGYDSNDYSSPDIDRSATAIKDAIPLDTDAYGNPIAGLYTFYCKVKDVSTSVTYSNSRSYNYGYSAPGVDVTQSYSLRTSELTSTDSTTYAVDAVTPSITRTHLITKPVGSGANAPGSSAAMTRVIGGGATDATRLWTGEWATAITSIISYEMETWDGSGWLIIGDSITGSETIDVTAVDSIHSIITALSAFFDRWVSAKESDRVDAQRLQSSVAEILSLWMEYEDALKNGGDYGAYATEMAAILNAAGLETPDGSETTTVIIPYGEGVGTSTGSVITFVSSTPTGGNPGDMAIGTVGSAIAWNVYSNVSGDPWVLMGNLDASNAPLLDNNVTNSPSSSTQSEEVLKSYTMPAGTLENTGELVEISALFLVSSVSPIDIQLKLYFGSKEIGNYQMTSSVNGYYNMKGSVYRTTSVNDQAYESSCEIYSTPNSEVFLEYSVASEAGGSSIDIEARSEKGSNGIIGDIVCKYLRVQKIS